VRKYQANQMIFYLKIFLCVNPVCKIFNATIQCLVRDHLLIDELWSDDPKKFTYFLSKSESILVTLSSFEIGWWDEKLGVKVISPRRGA
jgi:hypothetical protein